MMNKRLTNAIEKADILIDALPYIKKFRDKTIVIKYGGSFMYDEEIKNTIMDDISLMKLVGFRPIIVHGGGKDITKCLDAMQVPTQFEDGLRVTTKEVANVAEMVLSGNINKEIVSLLEVRGIHAIGISGKDGSMIKAKPYLQDGKNFGYVGEIEHINPDILDIFLNGDYTPVIAPIGTDCDNNTYNINADHAAYAIAVALKAEKLIYLTDTNGVCRDPEDPNTNISKLSLDEIGPLIDNQTVGGGMIPKVLNSKLAIQQGVGSVHILDGKLRHSLLLEIFTTSGIGTMIYEEK